MLTTIIVVVNKSFGVKQTLDVPLNLNVFLPVKDKHENKIMYKEYVGVRRFQNKALKRHS